MAGSLGLAWYQGQKNAQDAARGHMNTMLSMAKDAAEADKQLEYFSPLQKDLRARQDENSRNKLKAVMELDQLKKDIKTDPLGAASKLISEKYGQPYEVKKTADGRYIAQPVVTAPIITYEMSASEREAAKEKAYAEAKTAMAHTIDLGTSPVQMLRTLMQEKISSSEDLFTDYSSKADAEIAARLKTQEKILEETSKAQAQYMYGGQQKIAADMQNQRVAAGATLGAAGLGANAQVAAATNAKYHEVEPTIEKVAAGTMGFIPVMDTNGKIVDYQKSVVIDGKQSTLRLSEAPPEIQNRFIDLKQAGQTNFQIKQLKDPASGKVQTYDPTTSAIAAVRQRDMELKQSTLKPTTPGGLPTNTTASPGFPLGIRVEEGGVTVQDGQYLDPRTGLTRPASEIPFWMPRNEN